MTITDPELRTQWQRDGYVLLRKAVPVALIDRLVAEIAAYRATCGETKDEHGFGQRIGLFHTQNATSLQVALNPDVREFLAWAFADEPLLFGSLTFETGTEQPAHQDSIFFHTQPDTAMAGAWCALEDVHQDAGPLFYHLGSHLWGLDAGEDVLKAHPECGEAVRQARGWLGGAQKRMDATNQLAHHWHNMLAAKVTAKGSKPTPTLIQKGDVLIWHAHLVHGGLPRTNRALSRRSMVTHFIGRNACMFDLSTFFLTPKGELGPHCALKLKVRDDARGALVVHDGGAVTY